MRQATGDAKGKGVRGMLGERAKGVGEKGARAQGAMRRRVRSVRSRILMMGAVLSVLCALQSGCTTTEITRIIQQVSPYVDGDLTITLTFLDTAELVRRYGSRNPFLAPQRLITPIEFFVMELSVASTGDFPPIRTQDVQFVFGATGTKAPVSSPRLNTIWENEIDTHGTDVVRSNYKRLIRAHLLPFNISAFTTGLLLFQGNFPYGGDAQLSIPHPYPQRSQKEIKTIDEIAATPTEPGFDGQRIYFNFLVDFEETEKPFRFF